MESHSLSITEELWKTLQQKNIHPKAGATENRVISSNNAKNFAQTSQLLTSNSIISSSTVTYTLGKIRPSFIITSEKAAGAKEVNVVEPIMNFLQSGK